MISDEDLLGISVSLLAFTVAIIITSDVLSSLVVAGLAYLIAVPVIKKLF